MRNFLSVTIALFLLCSPANATEVAFDTDKGIFILKIDDKKAPITANNFLKYVEDRFFDGLIFHRVIPGFVIQGGGFMPDMKQRKTRQPIINEAQTSGLKNTKYSISMARTNDPNSATSQFFINVNDNASLDYDKTPPGYAVFGEVTQGREVIDSIAAVITGKVGPYQDVPLTPILINKAYIK